MVAIDLASLSAEKLLDAGERAARCGDRVTLEACISVLDGRKTKFAASVQAKLRNILRDMGSIWSHERKDNAGIFSGPVFDSDIAPQRMKLLEFARRSIFMTSLTFPNNDIVNVLEKKARSGVRVVLIFADRTRRDKHNDALDRLVEADAKVYGKDSTHSKILIVDSEWVMVGSANAHGGHLDANHVHRDRDIAKKYTTYVEGLMDLPIRG